MRIKNENFHPSSKYANMMKKHRICLIFSKIMIFAIFENFENFHINKFLKVFSRVFRKISVFLRFSKMKDGNFNFWFSYRPHKPILIKIGAKSPQEAGVSRYVYCVFPEVCLIHHCKRNRCP